MQTIADLKQRADRALFDERYLNALQLYTAMVELQPGNLDARLRVGDALLALGEVQRAAVVYTALARNAALAGYPLRALVALKVLSTLEPKLGVLLHEIAKLYARESFRVGQGARRTLPSSNEPLDEAMLSTIPGELTTLGNYAQQIAARYQSDAVFYPDRLLPIPLLSLLPEREFASVLEVVRVVRLRPDTWVLQQGDVGRSFFVLARGTVEVSTVRDGEHMRLAQLSEGSIFGEMVLLSNATRTASVRTETDCDLLEFDCELLSQATATLQHLSQALSGFARDRLLTNVTMTSPLFRPLDPRQRLDLVRRFISVDATADQQIIREGEQGQGLYVVLRGEVHVSRDVQGARREVAQLGPSEVFGEISLITRDPTSASVRAGQAGASLLFLHRDYFERLVDAVPELRGYFERLSEQRLLDLNLRADPGNPQITAADEVEVELLF